MEKSGIVESVPYVGTRVVELTMSDIIQIYTMRKALEPIASYNACKRISDETIKSFKLFRISLKKCYLRRTLIQRKYSYLTASFIYYV